ncbi:MAG: hypothetical protein AAGC71_09590 [Pseudomonadota bacterium]
MLPTFGSFSDKIRDDLDALRPGQQHAMCVVIVADVDADTEARAAQAIAAAIAELPAKAMTGQITANKLGIWLPRATRDEALTYARLLRAAIARAAYRVESESVLAPLDINGERSCAVGVVFANQNNWSTETLIATAEITAALAMNTKSGSIKIADQHKRSS